jgi:O-methyltransferase domain
VAGDFFDSIPEGDLYLLRFILHDWNDADCIHILNNCRRAMRPSSRVGLVESFLGRVGQEVSPDIADTQGVIIDLPMLATRLPRRKRETLTVGEPAQTLRASCPLLLCCWPGSRSRGAL